MSNMHKKYFPIKSEIEKDDFIRENRGEIYRLLEIQRLNLSGGAMSIVETYENRMKRTLSFRGNVKMGNVLHNRVVATEMEFDRRLKRIDEQVRNIDELRYKHSNNTLTIEDANAILEIENKEKEHTRILILKLVFLITFLGCLFNEIGFFG